jgi:hypothetical protein
MTRPRRYIWNATDGSFVKRLDGHKAAVSCCTWSELDMLMTGVHGSRCCLRSRL